MVTPGKYSLRLTVDGQSLTQPLEILRDPNAAGSDADLESSLKLQLRIREDINAVSDIVNQLEWMRKQLEDIQKMLRAGSKNDLLKPVEEMDQKMQNVEYKFFSKTQRTSDDKYFVDAYKVYLDLIWLNGVVGTGGGDVAGGADFKPTDASVTVLQTIEKDLDAARVEYSSLMEKDVPAFNRMLAQRGIIPLVTTGPAGDVSKAVYNPERELQP